MIRYAKGPPPTELTALTTTPGTSWDSLGSAQRTPIRDALIRDQGGLCAYCQQRIRALEHSHSGRPQMKIEHWIPRTESPEHHFTWSNLIGVCLGGAHDATSSSRHRHVQHCDTSRGNRKLFLHPVEGQGPDPRVHLRYTKAGRVERALPDDRIDGDIDALNLNAPHLVRARQTIHTALWERLERSRFATGELRRMAHAHVVAPGTEAPVHSEFVRYHLLKKLHERGALA